MAQLHAVSSPRYHVILVSPLGIEFWIIDAAVRTSTLTPRYGAASYGFGFNSPNCVNNDKELRATALANLARQTPAH